MRVRCSSIYNYHQDLSGEKVRVLPKHWGSVGCTIECRSFRFATEICAIFQHEKGLRYVSRFECFERCPPPLSFAQTVLQKHFLCRFKTFTRPHQIRCRIDFFSMASGQSSPTHLSKIRRLQPHCGLLVPPNPGGSPETGAPGRPGIVPSTILHSQPSGSAERQLGRSVGCPLVPTSTSVWGSWS